MKNKSVFFFGFLLFKVLVSRNHKKYKREKEKIEGRK